MAMPGAVPAAGVSTRRVSWSAILAGVFLAVAFQLLLSLLGAGLGLSTVDPLDGASPQASTLGTGAVIWWAVSSAIALFIAGAVSSHLAGSTRRSDATLQGLLTWAVAAIFTAYLLTSAVGAVLRGVGGAASTAASVTASGAAAVAGPATGMIREELQERGISLESIRSEAMEILRQTGKPGLRPEAIGEKAAGAVDGAASAATRGNEAGFDEALRRLLEAGQDTARQVDRDAVVNVLMQRGDLSREQAEQRVDNWLQTYREAQAKLAEQKAKAAQAAREAADAAARATSVASLGAVIVLLVGAIAAALGGLVGRQRHAVVA